MRVFAYINEEEFLDMNLVESIKIDYHNQDNRENSKCYCTLRAINGRVYVTQDFNNLEELYKWLLENGVVI